MASMDKALVQRIIRGWTLVDEFMETERMERLARISDEEARSISQDLVASWEALHRQEDHEEQFDLWQVEGMIATRRILDQMAQTKGGI